MESRVERRSVEAVEGQARQSLRQATAAADSLDVQAAPGNPTTEAASAETLRDLDTGRFAVEALLGSGQGRANGQPHRAGWCPAPLDQFSARGYAMAARTRR